MRKMSKLIILLLAGLMIFAGAANVYAADEVSAEKQAFIDTYGESNLPDVYFNGELVEFSDAFAVIIDGSTFIPISAFSTNMGATVGYEAGVVSIAYNGDVVEFTIGTDEVTLNGDVFTIPSETFVLNDRTYVPTRFIAEAFNYYVGWNSEYREVSVMDIDALKVGLDTDYTIINDIINFDVSGDADLNDAMYMQLEINYGEENWLQLGIGSFGNYDGAVIQTAFNFGGDDFFAIYSELMAGMTDDEALIARLFLNVISSCEVRIDFAADKVYFFSPYIEKIFGIEDVWVVITFEELAEMISDEYSLYSDLLLTETFDLESYIDQMIIEMQNTSFSYGNTYAELKDVLDYLKDSNFIQDGNDYSLTEEYYLFGMFSFDIMLYAFYDESDVLTDVHFGIFDGDQFSDDYINFDFAYTMSSDGSLDIYLAGALEGFDLAFNAEASKINSDFEYTLEDADEKIPWEALNQVVTEALETN